MNNSVTTKGIILAGGAGTRLHPITRVVSKQLLPIYDKPMIYYPLSTLINAGIDEIMIITTPEDEHLFKRLLGNGSKWNVSIDYAIQEKPNGIAQALLISNEWLNGSNSALILGDNLFFGPNINKIIKNAITSNEGATIFGYQVNDPNRFGVIEFDKNNKVLSVEEKPKIAKSNWAATGLYIYDSQASKKTEELNFSERGELEITELNNAYLVQNNLKVILLDDSFSWLDTGTHDTLLEASNFVRKIKNKFGEDSIGLI